VLFSKSKRIKREKIGIMLLSRINADQRHPMPRLMKNDGGL
jgi:hypothetical protein